jgi:hypothetical protein
LPCFCVLTVVVVSTMPMVVLLVTSSVFCNSGDGVVGWTVLNVSLTFAFLSSFDWLISILIVTIANVYFGLSVHVGVICKPVANLLQVLKRVRIFQYLIQ